MKANNHIETLIVDFYKVDAGWLFFKLTAGCQVFNGCFSEVFDPTIDFKNWLEIISTGVQQSSFTYNPEGNDIKFNFECVSWKNEILTILENDEGGEIFFKSSINRKQIVKAFYRGLLNFANSSSFKSDQWEVEFIKERLCKTLNLDEYRVIKILIELDRKKLAKLLFNAAPTYVISYPKAKDKNEEIQWFIDTFIQKPKPEEHLTVRTPNEWIIPDDYDYWQANKKKDYVTDCINEVASSYSGTKMIEFRSALIEQYLEIEYDFI